MQRSPLVIHSVGVHASGRNTQHFTMAGQRSGIVLAAVAALSALCGLWGSVASYEIKAVTRPVIMSESPFWDDESSTVIFVDVIGKEVLRYDPSSGELKSISFKNQTGRVTPAVPVRGSSQLLVGVGRVVHLVDVDWGAAGAAAAIRKDEPLVEVEAKMPGNRFNDGKADKEGRLWIGTMDDSRTSRRRRRRRSDTNKGELFRFDLHRHPEKGYYINTTCAVNDGLVIPNGMAWTRDNKGFYLADSEKSVVYRFDYSNKEGRISNRTVAFNFSDYGVPGAPDGLTMDVDGNLWIACVHGGRVIKVDPHTGKLLLTIKMGVTNVSAAEWGGANRDVLYVTSAKYQMDDKQLADEPNAGCMFAITGLGTRGLPNMPFAATSRSWAMRLSASWSLLSLTLFLSVFAALLH
ncbi:regucalcin-like [Thrips palmi]|uniref:Regucalcin n=1 Tax=Thrips palmi TaxID=161013 RepID=A0A6P9A4I3_THRPL|nr:regucalcin-like [Thrips palmi]